MAVSLTQQVELGLTIEKHYANFKKDSSSRKTLQYVTQHRDQLTDQWMQFEQNHLELHSTPSSEMTHEYFTSKCFNRVKSCYEEYLAKLNALLNYHSSTSASNMALQTHINTQRTQIQYMTEMANSIEITQQYTPGYYTAMLSALSSQWTDIQQLHCSIIQLNPQHNVSDYYAAKNVYLKASVHCQGKHSSAASQEQPARISNFVRLAPVTVPIFDGTYSQWNRFQEMFEEAIGTQPITNIQKLIHLKGSLKDAALNLVNHLPVTEASFQTAWKILESRYNNKYLITTEFLDKIISYPTSPGESSSFIRSLHDTVIECIGALNNIGLPTEHWDAIIHHLVVKKIDATTYSLYRQTLAAPRELQTLDNLLSFLELRFQSLEIMEPIQNKNLHNSPTKSSRSTPKTALVSTETSTRSHQQSTYGGNNKQSRPQCIMCKFNHALYSCSKFRRLSETERYNKVKVAGLCINCLNSKHKVEECPSRSCFKCNQAHHTLLHFEHTTDKTTNLSASLKPSNVKTGYTLLATAIIELMDKTNNPVNCRMLLDSGSQLSFITEKMLKKLKLSCNTDHIEISGLGNSPIKSCKRTMIALRSRLNNYTTSLEVFVIPSITTDQPSRNINTQNWPIPRNINLADPQFNRAAPVDLLIGAELFCSLLSVGQIRMRNDLPSLQNTVFGWIVLGKTSCSNSSTSFCGISTHEDDILENQLRRFWEIEEPTSTKRPMTLSERHCEEHFKGTVYRNAEGRFIVRLPFITNPSTLGNSEIMATRRFKSLERRLEKNPEVKREYALFIQEYIDLQHMEEVTREAIGNHHFILPHHCVLRPESKTTKLRVVFDGSAKTSNSKSLNDLMAVGPTIQEDLFAILLRFRKYKYVFTTDIQKMYRQILVNEDDQNYQIILWRNNPSENIKYYRLKTVTYGTRSAPYLATKCIQHLAEIESELHPLGSAIAMRDIYVDDIMTGSDSLHQLMASQSQIIHLLQLAGFQLHKWCSNSNQLLKYIPSEQQEIKHEIDKNAQIKTLGIIWLPKQDQFIIKASKSHSTHITKRTVLSDTAQLFDPLGLISPIIVTAKIFLQNLWALDLQWDASLPMNLHTKWQQFREELLILNDLRIPRHMLVQAPAHTQLHAFSDASEKAYGTTIYLRSTNAQGETQVHLVCSKSRVAPRKVTTIPRLELCAAKLMCDVVNRIQGNLDLHIDSTHFWTDSTIVLSWIKTDSTSFKTFVANRVAEIQILSTKHQWHHIPTQLNPADLVSRGARPKDLLKSSFWFNGPEFLTKPEIYWPCDQAPPTRILEEERSVAVSLTITLPDNSSINGINHKNNYKFVQRVVAYVVRFINNCKSQRNERKTDSALHLEEMNTADTIIIKHLQQKAFSRELGDLKRGKQCHKGSKLANLSPFLDQQQIIRVGGRLEQSSLQFDAKHQIVLPKSEHLVKLMVQNLHTQNLHAGPQALLAITRQRLWPLHGKQLTKKIVQQCITCFRDRPTLITQIMGNLPADRIQQSRPFSHVGVDFAGPIQIHYKLRGKRPTKAYICVFVCFATKAIHLEVASDLTTLAFIACLKRFIARRGRPIKIFSDNATNFIGARNDLHELHELVSSNTHQTDVKNHCTTNGIEWSLIPPRSPHFGGLWEAAVKSAKLHLRKILHSHQLTYEELNTIVTEIEAILNSRPITPMSNDPKDLQPLTPGHFLIGEPVTAINDTAIVNHSLQKMWSKLKVIRYEFWQRWSKEYLHELQYRNKWTKETEHLAINSLVLLNDSNKPPLSWHMGRVTAIHKGIDGRVRVVDIKTSSGTTKRAIHTICPLPLASENIINDNGLNESTSRAKYNESQFRKSIMQGSKPKRMRINPVPNAPNYNNQHI